MIGYIFNYHLTYDSGSHGTRLVIQSYDLLHYLEQGSIYPNLGKGGATNFHFSPNETLEGALSKIAGAFNRAVNPFPTKIVINGKTVTIPPQRIIEAILDDDRNTGTFATGFETGLKGRGKNQSKSIAKSLEHLTTPSKQETYLGFMVRLAKLAGRNIKMSDTEPNVIVVKGPTYDNTPRTIPKIRHYINPPNNAFNNVLAANYHFNMEHQASVVIVEANTIGDGKFYQSTLKGIAINELTAFPRKTHGEDAVVIASVKEAIDQLTTAKLGIGVRFVKKNEKLYEVRQRIPIDIDTEISMPFYTVSMNAHSPSEVEFAAAMALAEIQDKYLECTYRFNGWSIPGHPELLWTPDIMVEVTDEIFNPGAAPALYTFPMWVRRVNFKKDRGGGTITEIVCTLPYTHEFNIAEEPPPLPPPPTTGFNNNIFGL